MTRPFYILFVMLMLSGCKTTSTLAKQTSPHLDYITRDEVLRSGGSAAGGALPRTQRASEITSLWSSSPKSLFGDRRASQRGDVLTVVIEIDEEAEINNSIDQSRQSDQNLGLNALFGLPQLIQKALPSGASLAPAVDISRQTSTNGSGNIRRGEKITLKLAAQIVETLPNGYLYLEGQQRISVNNETRYLLVSGTIRTMDISRMNTITYDKIANARIYYGGEGQISNMVKDKIGQKVFNRILPF